VLTGKADALQVRCGAGRRRARAVGCVGKVKSAPAPELPRGAASFQSPSGMRR